LLLIISELIKQLVFNEGQKYEIFLDNLVLWKDFLKVDRDICVFLRPVMTI